jgi:radical SAM superfamily enzyme YgiQ (UPF0313 family)
VRPRRSIFGDRPYQKITLVEYARGCNFKCDFCSITAFHQAAQNHRPACGVAAEMEQTGSRRFFIVDDNIVSQPAQARELCRALIPLGVSWVGQASIHIAGDSELLDLLVQSGCRGVLIGFESLNPATLASMNKSFNTMRGGYEAALANLRRHRLRLYATFIFGYDADTRESFAQATEFAKQHRFYIAAFNHLTPFPGTPLYDRLSGAGRLLFERWWLDERYRYNMVPFEPTGMTAGELQRECLDARRSFYAWSSIVRRGFDGVNRSDAFMFRNFFPINGMLRVDTLRRDGFPLGDDAWTGSFLRAH